MKIRVIVWVLVGLVVIAAAVFFVATSGKRPVARKTLEDYAAQAGRTAEQLDRMAREAEQIRSAPASVPDREQKLAEASRQEAEARAALERVKSATDVREAEKYLVQAKEALRNARRALKLAAGPIPRKR